MLNSLGNLIIVIDTKLLLYCSKDLNDKKKHRVIQNCSKLHHQVQKVYISSNLTLYFLAFHHIFLFRSFFHVFPHINLSYHLFSCSLIFFSSIIVRTNYSTFIIEEKNSYSLYYNKSMCIFVVNNIVYFYYVSRKQINISIYCLFLNPSCV